MYNRNITIYGIDIIPIHLCGKEVMYQVKNDGFFELPFSVESTPGDHDYTTCDQCQATLNQLRDNFTKRLQGSFEKSGFPNCCPAHSNLVKYQEYSRSKDFFLGVPEMAAEKVIFTAQHIRNNISQENWFEEITNYIEYVVESFGSMPNNCGEPLFLSSYFDYVTELISSNDRVPEHKKQIIVEYFESFKKNSELSSQTEITDLVKTYQTWIEIFPFQLKAYFGDLEKKFQVKLPIFTGKPSVNPYLGTAKVKTHTKSSLIALLNDVTCELLNGINAQKLIDENVIKDFHRHDFELESEKLKLETKQLTQKLSSGELQYVAILKEWLNSHKRYFTNIRQWLDINDRNVSQRMIDPD